MLKKGARDEACQCQVIGRFFYNYAIPFNVAKSDELQDTYELAYNYLKKKKMS